MSRRRVLGTSILGVVAAAMGCRSDADWACDARSLAVAGLLDRDVATLGREYLAKEPAERSREALVDALGTVPTADPGGWLAAQVRDDFTSGNIVELGGWRLSRTELRVCALVALAAELCD